MLINSKILLTSLKRLQPAFVGSRIIQQLENFIITGNKIWGTDTVTTIIDTLPEEYAQPIILPFEELLRICNIVDGDLLIEEKKQSLTVKNNKDIWSIGKAEPIENYPAMPEYPGQSQQMPYGFFDALQDSSKCVLDDPYDFKRNICIDFKEGNIYIASGNGAVYYFARFNRAENDNTKDTPHIPDKRYTVTTNFVKSLAGIENGSISFSDKFSYYSNDKTIIISRLPDIGYVDFHPFLNVPPVNFICDKHLLIAALNKCFVYKLLNYYIQFSPTEAGFDISLNDRDFEKSAISEIKADHTIGQSFFLNVRQLQQVFLLLPSDIIHMSFTGPDKSLYFSDKLNDDGEDKGQITIILQPINA